MCFLISSHNFDFGSQKILKGQIISIFTIYRSLFVLFKANIF